ncbi:MAG TPA: universal stress protein [Gemmataceae bacterium]|nr:universal stress protein [Gemmataceae bacterium]
MSFVRTILYATDFSDCSKAAFRVACSLARETGARLMVVHVAPSTVFVAPFVTVPMNPVIDVSDHLRGMLAKTQPSDPFIRVDRHLCEGDPATEIVRLADEAHADLIVLGTHGRSGIGRLLLGSVAEQVLRKATCPVLTVRAPLTTAAPSRASNEAAVTS